MKAQKKVILSFVVIGVLFIQACTKSLVIKNVDYAQKIESVLTPDSDGNISDIRYGISFSILPFQFEEFKDSSSVQISEIRMIRNNLGYYFITAESFKNVYVMAPNKGELKLEKKIQVNENGLYSPVFNLRVSVVELIENSKNIILLNEKGILKEEVTS